MSIKQEWFREKTLKEKCDYISERLGEELDLKDIPIELLGISLAAKVVLEDISRKLTDGRLTEKEL